ncbi:MAG: hypothetical protein CVU79_10210 [Elusimicrobia bacterium HGW-Elusimicrobia-3]|nr:MAG: hypothetical protein CVU79_10210 [Elusimicrobia bacterium HGW-Elusimicrobia-3]
MAAEGLVNIGGHIKGPVLSDNVSGKAMVNGVKSEGSYSAGTYFTSHAFIMYVSKEISENVSVEAAPDFWNGGAGATPSLGKRMGETLKDTGGSTSFKFQELTVKYNLPDYGVQLKAGYMSLPFTQDYGKELFWGEEKDGGRFTLYGGSWHDAGLEIYKAFELGNVSLPASLYVLNGNKSSNRDNNNSRAVMFHVEPQIGSLKTFGSYGTGEWGDSVALSTGTLINNPALDGLKNKTFYRWSVGAEYAYKAFKLRGETAGSRYNDNLVLTNGNRKNYDDFGYYGKLFYTVVPEKLTAMLHYDNFVRDVASANLIIKEKYDTTSFTMQYEMAPAATLFLTLENGNWRNNDIATKKDYVKFNRITSYVRVTF